MLCYLPGIWGSAEPARYERSFSHPGLSRKMSEVSRRSGWILVKMIPCPSQYTTGRTSPGCPASCGMISGLHKIHSIRSEHNHLMLQF